MNIPTIFAPDISILRGETEVGDFEWFLALDPFPMMSET